MKGIHVRVTDDIAEAIAKAAAEEGKSQYTFVGDLIAAAMAGKDKSTQKEQNEVIIDLLKKIVYQVRYSANMLNRTMEIDHPDQVDEIIDEINKYLKEGNRNE